MRTIALLALALAGCGHSTNTADGAYFDSPASHGDLTQPPPDLAVQEDLAVPQDLAEPADLTLLPDLVSAGGNCSSGKDCSLFSSYCETLPCVCVALGKGEQPPPCNGNMVKCFVDPCMNKTAACVNGKCVAQ